MDTDPVAYWDASARNYDEDIFSTIDEDATGIISRTLDSFAARQEEGPRGRCVDLGCGAGKYLPALASRFRSVVAFDLSPKLVALAQRVVKAKGLDNVAVQTRDLAKIWYVESGFPTSCGSLDEMGTFGFAVMANVLIAPVSDSARKVMLRNAFRSLCPGGHLLTVVPSLESAMYVNMRCDEAEYDGPTSTGSKEGGRLEGCEFVRKPSKAEGADLLRGILKRSGVRTKHFLQPEFHLLATRAGFEVTECHQVTYSWRSELGLLSDEAVPRTLQGPPFPWDWLFVLRKQDA